MKKAIVRITRSDGKTFAFDDKPFGLLELTGVDAPTVEIFSEKRAVGDGDIITGQRTAARTVYIRAKSRKEGLNREMREAASRFFNPAYTFDAEVTYDGSTRTARDCRLKALALPTGNVYKALEIKLTLFCPAGYLDGGGLHGQDINQSVPRLGWPFVSLVDAGFNYSFYNFGNSIQVDNTGDAPTYMRAVFTVLGSDTVANPKLICGSAYVRVLTELKPGDVLEIDTETRLVRLNGKNALNLIDKESRIGEMRMEIGLNTIGFAAETHENQLSVRVYYALRYNGM